jgi:SAM-dependent methyltransferase
MNEIEKLLKETLNEQFLQAVISNPRIKEGILKIKVRPVEIKGLRMIQCESYTKTQVFHENLTLMEAVQRIDHAMGEFRQMQLSSGENDYTILISKKGKVTIQKRKVAGRKANCSDLSHNRKKHYILQEGIPVPFLQDLGVMTQEGKIVRTKFDKFRQINRFLEFIEDILPQLEKKREVTILDFGCGKSYLTFAMYYYLHELKHYDIRIIGLDLKADVIRHCSELAEKYGYEKLTFLEGDIADYEGVDAVDMVVTLHACDTATDYALAKAIGWGAKVILSVPCCQHELNGQMKNEILEPVMKYGLLKERFAALVTDGLRAEYLESAGYHVQVLEFIDMEHTPKNILLRAVKQTGQPEGEKQKKLECIQKCEEFLQVSPTLGKLMD